MAGWSERGDTVALAAGAPRDLQELDALLTGVIAKVDGVDQLYPSVALKVMKYVSEWAPF